jgi:hypothetical protein
MSSKTQSVIALGILLAIGTAGTASAQRPSPPSSIEQRRTIANRALAPNGQRTSALGRTAATPLRAAPIARTERVRAAELARAQRVLSDPRASAAARRDAGLVASRALHAMGEDLETRGDRAGAADAFERAATARWSRNDADMRFRSASFERAGRLRRETGDRAGAARSIRRAAEALGRLGTERDQLESARLYREEARLHQELGDARSRSDALVSAADAMTRAGHIVTASYQAFDRGAPSSWPESEHVLRARAHDHFASAGRTRDDANRGYREAGLSWWSARQATNQPRAALADP